jgi:hypothetical protein
MNRNDHTAGGQIMLQGVSMLNMIKKETTKSFLMDG